MSKLIKIFLITLFALAVSCSNEGKTGGGDTGGGETDYSTIEYGQFLPAKTSYTGYNNAAQSQTTTITIVKNSDDTCNLQGKVVLVGEGNYDSSTKKWKEVDINIKVNEWYRTKGETDNASSRSVDNLPSNITSFGAKHYFKAAYKDVLGTDHPDTYHLDLSINGDSFAFQGKAN